MQHFWCNVCWSSAAFKHQLIRDCYLRETEISKFNLANLFSFRILFNEYILWLEISMNDTTCLQIKNCFNDLIHAESNLSFLKLIRLNVIEKFTACNLVHDNIHVLFCLISLTHLDNVWMRNQLYNLNFLTEKISFSLSQRGFIDLLCSNYLL